MGNNKKDFSAHIPEIEKKIGYTFKDKSLITQAFTRTSYCNEHTAPGKDRYQSNEVLEFFGDSVLSAAIVSMIIKDFSARYAHGIKTELGEGDFSNIKSKLSDKKNLSDRMRELGLARFLRMGEGDKKLGIENEPSVMEDLFESIIGAIYIDSGMDMPGVIRVVSGMLSASEYLKAKSVPKQSAKNALQEWCADRKRRLPAPVYKTVSEKGPEHKRIYERVCMIGERAYATGTGKNQKLADADAAEKTLKLLMAEEKNAKLPLPDERAVERLMEYVRSAHLTTASFYDLGEAEDSTPERPSFRVSCKIGDTEAQGLGLSKKNARCDSAEKMLALIKKKSAQKESQKSKKSGQNPERDKSVKTSPRAPSTTKKRTRNKT